jgi:hypothetical protein
VVDKNATFFDESSKELQQLVTRRKKNYRSEKKL